MSNPFVRVLGPDDPNSERLGWAVYKLDDDFRCGVAKNTLTKDAILDGMEVAIPSLNGRYDVMKIVRDGEGFYATDGRSRAVLQMAEDDRKIWVCVAVHVRPSHG